MRNALLINPSTIQRVETRTKKFHRRFPPLSLLYIASMLRKENWTVTLADLNADTKTNENEIIEKANQADLVILTTNPYADWQCPSYAIEPIVDFCLRLPSEKLVLTGNHGTHFPGNLIERTKAKIVVRGEPEIIALTVARELSKKQPDLKIIEGISYRKDTQIFHNDTPAPYTEFDLPQPAYDLIDLNNYQYELLGDNFALLETTRGCPYACSFCNLSMFIKRYRKRPVQHVLDEIDELVQNQGCRSLYIFDLEFAVNFRMAEAVCKHLIEENYAKKYNFRWACQTRADSVTEPLLKLMKLSGCELIHFGVESGNGDILNATNKRIDKNGIRKGIFKTKKTGIKSAAFFMFGFPGENLTTYQETLDFALELNPTYASFHPLLPFPGSPLYTEKFGKGPYWNEALPTNKTYFTKTQENEISQFIKTSYKKYYLRPSYIWQMLSHGEFKHYKMQLKLFLNFIGKN